VPTLTARGVTFSATQGVPFSGVVATFTDSIATDTAAAFTATVAWGDGTTTAGVVGGAAGMFTVSGTHTYAAAGTFTVTVTIRHTATGVTATATSTANVGRQLAASGVMFTATQGVPFSGQVATFTDANTTDTPASFTTSINWGDGTTTAGVVGGAAGMFTVSGTHTYARTGTFTVTVTITVNANGASATATSTALVGAQLAATGVTFTATQGVAFTGTVANVTDANTADTAAALTATIAWGDGTTSAGVVAGGGGTFAVSGTHTYATVGTFTVTVSIVAGATGATATATSTALVGPELAASGVTFNALAGQSFTQVVANLTDANTAHTATTFTATIAWGDGTTSAGVVAGGAGTFTVSGTHTYATVGTFTVTVSITNTASGATATATSTAIVASALGLQAWGVTFNAAPGVPQQAIVVAHLVDSSPAPLPQGTIDWGDGTVPTPLFAIGTPIAGNFDIIGNHTFATSGTFTVTVSINDPSTGGTTGALSTAVVTPQLTASGTKFTGSPGVNLNSVVVAHFSDTNPSDTSSNVNAVVNWGDGTLPSPVFVLSTPVPGAFDVLGNHSYAASGTYTVTVSITAASGATASAVSQANIGPQLAVTGATVNLSPGALQSSLLIGHVSDTDAGGGSGTLTATADWGDGSLPSPLTVGSTPAAGVFDLLGSHPFQIPGTYTVQISVTASPSGATATATSTVVVGPQLSGSGATFASQPGLVNPVLVGHVTDTNVFDTASSLTAMVDWGDGTPGPAPLTVAASPQPGVFELVGTHAYRLPGSYTVVATVTAALTGQTISFVSNAIVSPGPTLSGVTFDAPTGTNVGLLLAHIVDGNPSDTTSSYFVTIDFGDGSGTALGTLTQPRPGFFDVTSNHAYATAGTFTVQISALLVGTGFTLTTTATANVADPSVFPKLRASGTTFNAGLNQLPPAPGFLVASFVDTDTEEPAGNLSVAVDWGDGSPLSSTASGLVQVVSLGFPAGANDVFSPHLYATAGTFTITVTVRDTQSGASSVTTSTAIVPSGLFGSGTAIKAIPGVAPPLPGLLVASFADVNAFEPVGSFLVTIDWGDGSPVTSGSGAVFVEPSAALGSFDVLSPHTYATTGTFTVSVTITSQLTGSSTAATSTVTLAEPLHADGTKVNAIPGVVPPAPGLLVASFTDADAFEPPNNFVVTIDWGDGTPPSGTTTGSPVSIVSVGGFGIGAFDVFAPHAYATPGTFTVTVNIKSTLTNGTAAATSTVTVAQPLLASGTTINATPGVLPPAPGFLVGSFTDATPGDGPASFAVTVDWGDGSPPSTSGNGQVFLGAAVPGSNATFDVFSPHVYASSGTFTVTLTITSNANGAAAAAVSTAEVVPKLLASGAVLKASAGAPIPPGGMGFIVASVIDAALFEPPFNFAATIDWGDGTPPTLTGTVTAGVLNTFILSPVLGTFDLVTTHTYASPGTFTATITITDNTIPPGPLPTPPPPATTTTTAKFQVGP